MRLIQCVWWDCAICANSDDCIFYDWSHYAICLFDLMIKSWRVNLTVRASLLLLQMANYPNFVSFVSLNGWGDWDVTGNTYVWLISSSGSVCFCLFVCFYLWFWFDDQILIGWSHLRSNFEWLISLKIQVWIADLTVRFKFWMINLT